MNAIHTLRRGHVSGYSVVAIVLIMFFIAVRPAAAAQVTLAWDANSEADLAGYRIHYGTVAGNFSNHIDVKKVTSYTVSGLTAGQTYYFAASAYDTAGNESGYSNSVSSALVSDLNIAPNAPAAPSGPASLTAGASAGFTTSASDPNGDSLQFRYDWGAGVLSAWGTAAQSNRWSATGQYAVKAQARDSLGLVSAWSATKWVSVTASAPPANVDSDGDGVPDSQDAFPGNPKEWADANGNGIGDNTDAAVGPATPSLAAPANHATVSTAAVLTTGAYRGAGTGSAHAKTRWQVFRDEDDVCVFDRVSSTALTTVSIPRLVLEEGTPYFWRAQFIDSKGAASAWSDYGYFATQVTGSDRNANGIADTQEVPFYIDMDRDGVRDYRQATIRSFRTAKSGVLAGISIKGCATALSIEQVESEPVPASASGASPAPFGRINSRIAVARPGDRATATVYLSKSASSGGKYYRYDSIAGNWVDGSANAALAADRKSVVLTLVDGGAGDVDGIANGVIVTSGGIYIP
jgi:hypothetical protein